MIEARIKPKRKTKPGLKNRFAELSQPVPIDFIAYLPLEECAVRLESREKHSWWHSTKTYITITPVDNTVYDFTIRRERKRYGPIEAQGCLQDYEGNATYVTGEVITLPKLSVDIVRIFIVITWLALIFRPINVLLFFALMGTLGTIVYAFAQMHYRHELVEMIETTLGY